MRINTPVAGEKRYCKRFAFLPTLVNHKKETVWLEVYYKGLVYRTYMLTHPDPSEKEGYWEHYANYSKDYFKEFLHGGK